MLETKLLQTFREVAVRGSFSAAADALSFTQPAVSQHIARLEKSLDVRLLERDARGVTLTPAGEVLLRHADAVLDSLRRAEREVNAAAGADRPLLRVGAFSTVAAALVPAAFRMLRDAHPCVELDLKVVEPDEAIEGLLAGHIELAVTTESDVNPPAQRRGVEFLHLYDDDMLIAVPVGHRLASQPSIAIADLCGEPWIVPTLAGTCADSNIILRACQEAGFSPDIRLESDDYQAIQGLVASGMGVACIPTLAAISVRGDVVVRPVRGRVPQRRILGAVRQEGAPLVDQLIDALRKAGDRMAVPGNNRLTLVA